MRFLKITIITIFIVFSAACFLLSSNQKLVQKHHAQTVLKANSNTIKGDFERENYFEFQNAKAEMSRNGDDFFIRFNNAEIYKLELVVGDEKLEEYVARKDGKLVHLPIAYDLLQKRWIHLNATFFEADSADFFDSQKDWETNCASCHLEQNAQTFPTDCAACHSKKLHESETEIVRFAAREHQGILRSVCFVKNKGGDVINCQSCHSSDNLKNVSEQSCINCHQQFSAPQAVFEHSKHQPNSANCFNCHQPEIVYGHLEFQRTHEINIPNAELTTTKNIPNACNLCHTDKSANWAIVESKKLWNARFHDAKVSNDSQFDQPESVRALFAGDAWTRVLAADVLSKNSAPNQFSLFALEAFATEDYPLVRYFLAKYLRKELPIDEFSPKAERVEILSKYIDFVERKKIETTAKSLRAKRKNPDFKSHE